MSYSAEQIADTIIHLSRAEGDQITNLKLQKLLYYTQAWWLIFEQGNPLFADSFEAWVHGPVVPAVFRKFKHLRWSAIDVNAAPIDDERVVQHIKLVLKTYGRFDAKQLERITHAESPWRDARKGIPVDESSHSEITVESMREFYKQKIAEML